MPKLGDIKKGHEMGTDDKMGVDLFIKGIPYSQQKPRGDREAPSRWTEAVKQATKNLRKVEGPCYMKVVFVLPEDKYPSDHPYGPDLDNLMKRLLDALSETVFSKVAGKDGSVVQLVVSKRKAMQNEPPGARVIIAKLAGEPGFEPFPEGKE